LCGYGCVWFCFKYVQWVNMGPPKKPSANKFSTSMLSYNNPLTMWEVDALVVRPCSSWDVEHLVAVAHSSLDESRSLDPFQTQYRGCLPCCIRWFSIVDADTYCLQPLHFEQGQTMVVIPFWWVSYCSWRHNLFTHSSSHESRSPNPF